MLQWRALEMSAQHAARPRHRGIFIRRLLGRAGVAEAVEVVVATLHRRRHHRRHRRRHRRHRRRSHHSRRRKHS